MTILTICQEVAIKLNQVEPATLFSSTEQFDKEIRTEANETAEVISKAHDWQDLIALETITGDGTTTSFPLPADYDRMVQEAKVLTSQFASGLTKARDLNHWLDLQINEPVAAPGFWIILGGAMQILPALESGVTAKFYYVKNTVVTGAASAQQERFIADTDTFNLPDRLLRLGLIWRWRSTKGKEYSEAMANYEIALGEEITRDKGSRILTVGRQRMRIDANFAHPAIVA